MDALDKTRQLVRLPELPLSLMVKNDKNPNKMKPREFDLLCDNFNKIGWTEPVLARPQDFKALDKIVAKAGGDPEKIAKAMLAAGVTVKIVGGHHRFEAGSFLGFEVGPCNIIMDPDFDEEQEKFQIVRMNVIHGRLDPTSFTQMYNELSEKYSNEILQDAFGFAEEAEFKKLILQMAKTLPDKPSQDKFKEAAKEIKTIEGLTKLLNHMFATYGNTLPYGYMVFTDEANTKNMWLRVSDKSMKALEVIGDICIAKNRTIDDIVGRTLQLIANGDSKEFVDALIAETPEVKLPGGMQTPPTHDNIQKMHELEHA